MITVVRVTVTPDARKERFTVEKNGTYTITVREEATHNLANDRVCELLAAHFHVPRAAVRIEAGHRSPRKRVRITSPD